MRMRSPNKCYMFDVFHLQHLLLTLPLRSGDNSIGRFDWECHSGMSRYMHSALALKILTIVNDSKHFYTPVHKRTSNVNNYLETCVEHVYSIIHTFL